MHLEISLIFDIFKMQMRNHFDDPYCRVRLVSDFCAIVGVDIFGIWSGLILNWLRIGTVINTLVARNDFY